MCIRDREIKARKGKVIALVTEGDTVISKLADDCIELPETLECLEMCIRDRYSGFHDARFR